MIEPARYQLFPDLSDDDYDGLKRDIRERGVMVAVEYDDAGEILDGHHRVRAWTELVYEGAELEPYPRVIREGWTEAQKRAHVRRLNILRRHLTQEQKRELIRDQVRETPERSNRQVARDLGVDHKTVGSERERLESTGEIPQSDQRQGADGRVINTGNIGRQPSPRRAPDPEDDDSEGVDRDTAPSSTGSVAIPNTQAIRDANLRADFAKCLVSVAQIVCYAPERLAAVLDVNDADHAERGIQRLADWLTRFRAARRQALHIVGE